MNFEDLDNYDFNSGGITCEQYANKEEIQRYCLKKHNEELEKIEMEIRDFKKLDKKIMGNKFSEEEHAGLNEAIAIINKHKTINK